MKVRIKFSKLGALRYVGHLDFMRAVQKMIRRSSIKAAYTKGFNPHHILSFASPLGVGLESVGEYFDLELAYRDPFEMNQVDLARLNSIGLENDELPDVPPSEWILEQLNDSAPEGVRFLEVKRVAENNSKAMALVRAADYTVFLKKDVLGELDVKVLLQDFLSQKEIIVHKVSKKTESDVDIRPLIYAALAADADRSLFAESSDAKDGFTESPDTNAEFAESPDDKADEQSHLAGEACRRIVSDGYPVRIDMKLSAGSAANLKPETVCEALCAYAGKAFDALSCRVLRREMYMDAGETLTGDGVAF